MNFLRNLLTKVTYLGLDNIQPGLVLNLFLILPKNPGWDLIIKMCTCILDFAFGLYYCNLVF